MLADALIGQHRGPPSRRHQCSIDISQSSLEPFTITTSSTHHVPVMQTLWSRIAQVRGASVGCRCPQCIPSTSGISRRSGATATRRASKYLTSSTLLYSGIFATAATFDAGVKQQRRRKWDRAIEEVRLELGEGSEADIGGRAREGEGSGSHVSITGGPHDGADVKEDDENIFQDVEPTGKRPRWPTNTGTPLQPWKLAPESIYASDARRARSDTRGWSPKKMEMNRLSVDMLQLKILLDLQNRGFAEEGAQAVPDEYGRIMLHKGAMIEALRSLQQDLIQVRQSPPDLEGYVRATPQHMSLASFDADSWEAAIHHRRGLDHSLKGLFHQHRYRRITTPSLLAQICHSLSTSPSPPTLKTFNILLLGFTRTSEQDIVGHTIKSLRRCNLRPNEVTNAAILAHYTSTNNAEGFVHWVDLMRGKHTGLALAQRNVRITAACAGRLVPKDGEPHKIIQLPYPTPGVFGALIQGVIKFAGFETALGVCQKMGEEGWGLCMSGMRPLLHDCAERGDWASGLGVWQQIRRLEAKAARRAASERVMGRERIPVEVFASMLRLCVVKGERGVYDEVWAHATKEHRYHSRELVSVVRERAGIGKKATEDEKADGVATPVAVAGAELDDAALELDGGLISPLTRDSGVQTPDPPPRKMSPGCDAPSTHPPQSRPTTAALLRVRKDRPRPRSGELTMEHLHGSLAGHNELDEYEAVERPMSMYS